MKRNKTSKMIPVIIALLCVICVIFGANIRNYRSVHNMDYDKANKITDSFDEYGMTINTIVTIDDGENLKQNTIDQTVGVTGKNKGSMLYNVETTSTLANVNSGKVDTEKNSYMYYDNYYYYSYPGVKYKSPVEPERAEANIENLMNIISFDYDDMENLSMEYEEEYAVFNFTVGYNAVSDYVKSLLQSSINTFENGSFKPVEISATARVHKAKVVENRELYVEYVGENGEKIVLEIYTSLTDTPKLELPDESKYVNIAG